MEDIDKYLCQLVFEVISDWQIQCCQINDLTKYQDHPLIKPSFKVGWAFFDLFAARFVVVVVAVCPRLQQLSLATPFAVLFLLLFSLFTFFFEVLPSLLKGKSKQRKRAKKIQKSFCSTVYRARFVATTRNSFGWAECIGAVIWLSRFCITIIRLPAEIIK